MNWKHSNEQPLETSETDSNICRYSDGWYFWDETGAERLGPFDTEDEATQELIAYAAQL